MTDEDEELVEKCLEIIRQEKRASTSLLQRRLRSGYHTGRRGSYILRGARHIGPRRRREAARDSGRSRRHRLIPPAHGTARQKITRARLARNISLEEAARVTKIRPSRIQEIEAEDFSGISSLAYAKGFLLIYGSISTSMSLLISTPLKPPAT